MKQTLIILALMFCVGISFATNEHCIGIESGTKAYNEGEFERAIDEWRSCVDNGYENADLFFNLGNAYFRNGNLGFSIYYYKTALKLRPNDEDIQHNLNFAQSMTKDKVENEEENPILSTLFKIHHALSLKVQLFILLGLFWFIAIISVVHVLVRSGRSKNICTGVVFCTTIIFGIIGASAAYKIIVAETEITGVVTAKDADVTSAPNDKSQTLNTLSEGTCFSVLSEQGNFVEIQLGESIRGFVKKSNVGIVK